MEWPIWMINDEGIMMQVYSQDHYDSALESGFREATNAEIEIVLNEWKVANMKGEVLPFIASLIIECKTRLDAKPISAVDISSIINSTNGKIDVDEMNKIIDEHNEELVEYAICATTFIDIVNAVELGTIESMKLISNMTWEECYESCRTMWNKVSLKNLHYLTAHGFTEELFDLLHKYSTNPTLLKK